MFRFLALHLAKRLFKNDNTNRQVQLAYITMMASAGLALLTLLLTTWFYYQQSNEIAQHTIDSYGESLASLAADRIAVTTFNQDPISLQAVVQAIARKNAVTSVITYDVNNTILAQAEKQQIQALGSTAAHLRYYTAPVTVSSELAGSITIGIDPISFNGSISYLPIWCIALLLTVIALMAYRHLRLDEPNSLPTKAHTSAIMENTNEPSLDTPKLNNKIDNTLAILNIQLMNMDVLQQQLNAESRQQQLQQLQQDIDHSVALYNASTISITHNSIILNFGCANKDNIFNALCCGQLLLQLNQEKCKTLINMVNTVQCVPEHYQLEKTISTVYASYHAENNIHQLLIDSDIIEQYELDNRITLTKLDNQKREHPTSKEPDEIGMHFLAVEGFQQSYATLITNQLLQLQKQQTQ